MLGLVLTTAHAARAAEVTFRDDFNAATLSPGWSFVNENPATHSLTARPGFMRINTERGAPFDGAVVRNLLLRQTSGTVIIETRVEFNPQVAQQFAGLVIYEDDEHAVAFGLAHATGERGRFRGVVLLAVGDFDPDTAPRPAAFYDENTADNPNVVFLRLLRSGNQFAAAFSENGTDFIEIGTVTNDLPDQIRVGLGATNGDFAGCGSDCDRSIPADFDFFQITRLEGDEPTIEPALASLAIEGPGEIAGGTTAVFIATATFDDGSTQNVTTEADWMAAPPELARIDGGLLVAESLENPRQVTVVATYVQITAIGSVSVTDSVLLRIVPGSGSGGTPGVCGMGLLPMIPLMMAALLGLRLARPLRSRTRLTED